MMKNPFIKFKESTTNEELRSIQQQIYTEGFSTFFKYLDGFTEMIKKYPEDQVDEIKSLLKTAKQLFPHPNQFSPSWKHVWEEFEGIVQVKTRIFNKIPVIDRSGEWQVIMDNPFTSQEVVCYPSLTFIDAIYLYAYFLPKMENNEYLRLQKVQTLIMEHHPFQSIETESFQ